MASVFTKIINREIPGYIVAEDENHIAFLDVNPIASGHTLVVPKREEDYIFSLEDEHLSALMIFAKKVAMALEKAVPCKRIGVAVIGLEVPHTHVHLVPLNFVEDINFSKPKLSLPAEVMEKLCSKIKEQF